MKNTKNFASRWGFILASVGSAVGMANVWGFPNKLGSNGGGAFLLIYLLFVVIFGTVGLPTEFAIGRRAGTGTLGAYKEAWGTRGKTAQTYYAVQMFTADTRFHKAGDVVVTPVSIDTYAKTGLQFTVYSEAVMAIAWKAQ